MRVILESFLLLVGLLAAPTTLIAQSLISIDPNTAQRGESLGVGISGEDTHFEQATSMMIWFSQGSSNIYAYGYYPVDDTFMTAWFDIPSDATTGLHDLNVDDNLDGMLTLYDSFTIDPGGIVSVNPDTAQQGMSLGKRMQQVCSPESEQAAWHEGTLLAQISLHQLGAEHLQLQNRAAPYCCVLRNVECLVDNLRSLCMPPELLYRRLPKHCGRGSSNYRCTHQSLDQYPNLHKDLLPGSPASHPSSLAYASAVCLVTW